MYVRGNAGSMVCTSVACTDGEWQNAGLVCMSVACTDSDR